MEDQIQKILSLQEEIIHLQKTGYNISMEATKKIYDYKVITVSLLVVVLLALAYALVVSLLYFV